MEIFNKVDEWAQKYGWFKTLEKNTPPVHEVSYQDTGRNTTGFLFSCGRRGRGWTFEPFVMVDGFSILLPPSRSIYLSSYSPENIDIEVNDSLMTIHQDLDDLEDAKFKIPLADLASYAFSKGFAVSRLLSFLEVQGVAIPEDRSRKALEYLLQTDMGTIRWDRIAPYLDSLSDKNQQVFEQTLNRFIWERV